MTMQYTMQILLHNYSQQISTLNEITAQNTPAYSLLICVF